MDFNYSRVSEQDLIDLREIDHIIQAYGRCMMRTEAVRLSKLKLVTLGKSKTSYVDITPLGRFAIHGLIKGTQVRRKPHTVYHPSHSERIGVVTRVSLGTCDADGWEVVADQDSTQWVIPVLRAFPIATIDVKFPEEPWATWCYSCTRCGWDDLEVVKLPWEVDTK